MFLVFAVLDHAEFVAHAPFADHLAREPRHLFDVTRRPARDVVRDNFLSDAARHGDGDDVEEFFSFAVQDVVLGQIHRRSQRLAAWDDGDFVQRMSVLEDHVDQRMAGFVPGSALFVFVGHGQAAALAAPANFVAGFFQFGHGDGLLARPGSEQRGFVQQVGQLRARITGGAPGDDRQIR